MPADPNTTLPPPTPWWRRRLGRFLYGWARRVYPEMANQHDTVDRACASYSRELKIAWRKLDEYRTAENREANRILAMTDDEVMADAKARGVDVEKVAADGRAMLARVLRGVNSRG
jgi:hypothetical protein